MRRPPQSKAALRRQIAAASRGGTGPAGPPGAQGATGASGAAGQGVPTGGTTGQVLQKASGTDYDTEWATPAGGGGNAFGTVAVSGQSNVVADSSADTLTLAAGANIALTTDAGADSVTIAVTGLTSNATHTGDVTGATALTIANDAVTYAKMQNVSAASRLLGRGSAGGAGDVEEISIGSGLSLSGTTLSAAGGSGPVLTLAIHADATANITLTNQVSGEQFLANNNRNITRADLTAFTEARLVARVVTGSASANSPRIRLMYDLVSGGFSTTIGNYTNAAASGEVSCSLTTAGVIDSGWVALAAGALADVYLAVTQIGGDGAADPAIGNVTLYLR